MQQQRLLDLGRVEHAAAALGGELRVVGEHDRGAQHGVVGLRGEHGPGVDLRAALRQQRRGEAPAVRAREQVGGEQAVAQRLGAVDVRPGTSVSLTTSIAIRSPSSSSRARPRTPPSSNATSPGSGSSTVPARQRTVAAQETCLAPFLHAALHPHPVVRDGALARVLRRVDDPERRRRRVLGRLRRVGIELVALPHERVDERLERGHPQQLRDRGVVAGQPVGGLARGEPVERRGLQAHPAPARVVRRHQRAPRLHRQLARAPSSSTAPSRPASRRAGSCR